MPLDPSWIEIPVHDLERATAFYRTVFGLDQTPRYQALGADVVVLLASNKDARAPGVSLVKSRLHTPSLHGPVVNIHLGTHAALMAAVEEVVRHGGGGLASCLFDAGDGTGFQHVRDCEGNTLALSSRAPPKEPQS